MSQGVDKMNIQTSIQAKNQLSLLKIRNFIDILYHLHELFNEVSMVLYMQICYNRVVESSSGAKTFPHTKNQPCIFKINDFDILGFLMIDRAKFFFPKSKNEYSKLVIN